MRETGIVYGNSLFSLAADEGVDSQIKEELALLKELLSEEKDFFSLLDAPQLSKEERLKMAEDALGSFHPYVLNTVKLLVEGRKTASLSYLISQYEKMYNKAHNIAPVTAITAAPLSESQAESLKVGLEKQFGKEIILTNKINPSVLGGVVLRTDGLQIDGSVKSRLEDIKKEIVR